MGYAIVLGGVEDSIRHDGLLIAVGGYLELCSGGLSHRPRKRLIVDADCHQVRACLFDLVVVLSQPGELLCARASPETPVEYQHHRRPLSVFRQNNKLAVAVWKREVRRLVSELQRQRLSRRTRRGELRRRERRLACLPVSCDRQHEKDNCGEERLHRCVESNLREQRLSILRRPFRIVAGISRANNNEWPRDQRTASLALGGTLSVMPRKVQFLFAL